MITRDRNMENQQNITADVAVVILYARSNALRDLRPMAPKILETLKTIQRGQVIRVYP